MTAVAAPRPPMTYPTLAKLRERHRPWANAALASAALMTFCLAAGWVDERTLNDVSVWAKPFTVAAYRKPAAKVTVEMLPGHVPGKPARARVSARYFFGGAVKGASG